MTDDLRSLFDYHRWADGLVIASCRSLAPGLYEESEPFEVGWPSIRSVVVHLAWANEIWIRRFLREPLIAMWKETDLPTLDAAETSLMSNHDRLVSEVLPAFTPDDLAAPFTYRNFQGRLCTAPLWALLQHVVNHGTYHRGQVASKLKRRGVDPPTTDFVYWAISNTPQPPTSPA